MTNLSDQIDAYIAANQTDGIPAWTSGGTVGFFDFMIDTMAALKPRVQADEPLATQMFQLCETLMQANSGNAKAASVVAGVPVRAALAQISEIGRQTLAAV